MPRFPTMTLSRMLTLGFFGVIIVGVLVAAFAAWRLAGANQLQNLTQARLGDLGLLQEIKDNANLQARLLRDSVIDLAALNRNNGMQRMAQADARNTDIVTTFRKLVNGAAALPGIDQREVAEASSLLAQIEKTMPAYWAVTEQVKQQGAAGNTADAYRLIAGPLIDAQVPYFAAVDAMIAYQRRVTLGTSEQSERDLHQALIILLILTILSVILGGVTGWSITRRLKAQLGGEPAYAAQVARAISQGNLRVDVTLKASDTNSVLAAMRTMRDDLATMVGDVRQSSEAIATGANQIASGNADLSQRTEEQASSLEQTAAAMEQMNATVRQNADTLREVTELAHSASATAARGGQVVSTVVHTMEAITESSKKIADINGVIDAIAFQTNILALNAAVEAARAGEQGKGFAVVAGEVRTLAQRSAQAAKEIKTLIGESALKVSNGAQQVSEAGATMHDIVEQVGRVATLITEIAAATREQTQSVSQVSDAVNQLDQVTQQNAALVEESAAAAESLSEQAARLVALVSVFQLEGAAAQNAPTASRSSAPRRPSLALSDTR